MKLYYYTKDNGDGSSSVRWCKEENYDNLLIALEDDDTLYQNEGSADYITLPDGFDLESLGLSKWLYFGAHL